MSINKAGLDLIKEFEGFRSAAYVDPVGVLTIGYGTTAAAGVGITPQMGMKISEPQAEAYLVKALDKFGALIKPHISAPINENEWAAFMSLAYNIGPGAFAKSSALRKFNAGDKRGAANAILLWNRAGGRVMKGLERRRAAERALFLSPTRVDDTPRADPVIKTPKIERDAPIMSAKSPWAALLAFIASLFRKNSA